MNKEQAIDILTTTINEAYPIWSSSSYETEYNEAMCALNYLINTGGDDID